MAKVTIDTVQNLGERVIEISRLYKIRRKGELFFDAIMHAMLASNTFGRIQRQLPLRKRPGQRRSQRLDFRVGGTAPVVIELAVRKKGGELSPSQNRSELQKLTRHRKATTRFLLLLDPTNYSPPDRKRMKQRYCDWNPGRGRFERLPVRVIYAKPGHSFHFLWTPYK